MRQTSFGGERGRWRVESSRTTRNQRNLQPKYMYTSGDLIYMKHEHGKRGLALFQARVSTLVLVNPFSRLSSERSVTL